MNRPGEKHTTDILRQNGNQWIDIGEKWDQAFLYDVDHDGDTDIIANCAEYGTDDGPPLAVVWFENPMK